MFIFYMLSLFKVKFSAVICNRYLRWWDVFLLLLAKPHNHIHLQEATTKEASYHFILHRSMGNSAPRKEKMGIKKIPTSRITHHHTNLVGMLVFFFEQLNYSNEEGQRAKTLYHSTTFTESGGQEGRKKRNVGILWHSPVQDSLFHLKGAITSYREAGSIRSKVLKSFRLNHKMHK